MYKLQERIAGKNNDLPLMDFLKEHDASGRLVNAIYHFLSSMDSSSTEFSVLDFCRTVSKKELLTIRNLGEVSRLELIRLLESNGYNLKKS